MTVVKVVPADDTNRSRSRTHLLLLASSPQASMASKSGMAWPPVASRHGGHSFVPC